MAINRLNYFLKKLPFTCWFCYAVHDVHQNDNLFCHYACLSISVSVSCLVSSPCIFPVWDVFETDCNANGRHRRDSFRATSPTTTAGVEQQPLVAPISSSPSTNYGVIAYMLFWKWISLVFLTVGLPLGIVPNCWEVIMTNTSFGTTEASVANGWRPSLWTTFTCWRCL